VTKRKREEWDGRDWLITGLLVVVFAPIGLAAMWRWLEGKRVWR
jgi:hypothetical protein